MSATHDERTAGGTTPEPDLRIEVDAIVHHSLWPGLELPFFNFTNTPSFMASGGGNGGTTYVSPRVIRRYYGGYGSGLYIPNWMSEAFGLLAVLAAATALTMLAAWSYNQLFGGHSSRTTQGITIVNVLHSKHFATDYHSLCGIAFANNGQDYRLTFNRGGACSKTVGTVVPVEKVQIAHGPQFNRNNGIFVFNQKVYALGSAAMQAILGKSLGEQLKIDLRTIVVRLKPKTFAQLSNPLVTVAAVKVGDKTEHASATVKVSR